MCRSGWSLENGNADSTWSGLVGTPNSRKTHGNIRYVTLFLATWTPWICRKNLIRNHSHTAVELRCAPGRQSGPHRHWWCPTHWSGWAGTGGFPWSSGHVSPHPSWFSFQIFQGTSTFVFMNPIYLGWSMIIQLFTGFLIQLRWNQGETVKGQVRNRRLRNPNCEPRASADLYLHT